MLVYQMVPGNIVLHIGDSGINHEDIETSPWIKHLVIWNQPLVGGLEHELYFPYIGNVIIPTDELIFFRGVETTNQTIKMIFGYIRIYRNLNSSWQYYKWVYAYFYAIISGILPNSQQSFWGRILTNHHIGYIWCISSWASNCSKPFWPNNIFAATVTHGWVKVDQDGLVGFTHFVAALAVGPSDESNKNPAVFPGVRRGTWLSDVFTDVFLRTWGIRNMKTSCCGVLSRWSLDLCFTVRWLWWSMFLLEFWHFGGVQLMFCGWVGYWSKHWHLVNPKIVGKLMFGPLKLLIIGFDPPPVIIS